MTHVRVKARSARRDASVIVDSTGRVGMVWWQTRLSGWQSGFSFSKDRGVSWSYPAKLTGPSDSPTAWPVTGADAKGTAHVAFTNYEDGPDSPPTGIHVAHAPSGAVAFNPSTRA